MELIFEKSMSGRRGVDAGTPKNNIKLGFKFSRTEDSKLPELSELDVVRHFTKLSRKNFSVDTHFYPLGSCTMKYNPKVNEVAAALPGFAGLHPITGQLMPEAAQGALEVVYEISSQLCEITGMAGFTTQPYAGAHGELTGIFIIAAYHKAKGNKKKYIICPEAAHGTNPASAAMGGYEVISIPVDAEGEMDLDLFKAKMTNEVAGVMMTMPNTVGIFHKRVIKIIEIAHKFDALMYYDGANLNAILGKVRPGDIGFDVMHVNLHKTFSTPHGGGGPGSGMVGVGKNLLEFLPSPCVRKNVEGKFFQCTNENSIGPVASFYGNFGVLLKAYTYILMLGREGIIDATEMAVLNANYVMAKLKEYYYLPYDRSCMHECTFSARNQVKNGVHALDIAKALIDRGIHPPTIYFPLVVEEAIMIEPTETESRETLDEFIAAMIDIAKLASTAPEKIKSSPNTTEISRPDETKAAKEVKTICEQ